LKKSLNASEQRFVLVKLKFWMKFGKIYNWAFFLEHCW